MGKFGPFKRKMDWRGKLVRLVRGAVTRGGDKYPDDTVFEVTSTNSSQHGYHLQSPECELCGHSGQIRLATHHDMELVGDGPLDSARERLRRERNDLAQRLAEAQAALAAKPMLPAKPPDLDRFNADAHQLYCRSLDDVEVMIDALDDPDRRWFAAEDLLTYINFGHNYGFEPVTGEQLRRMSETLGGHTSVHDTHVVLLRVATHRLREWTTRDGNGGMKLARFFDPVNPYARRQLWAVHGRVFVSEGAAEAYSNFRAALDELPPPELAE
jgi:hypothetical protein